MNRIVFLTDLRKLLTFMTEEERENTIRYYEGLLDDAGPEKEEELLREFGTPTKAAVTIFREYGKNHSTLDPRTPDGAETEQVEPESFVPENLGISVPDTIEEESEDEAEEAPEAEDSPDEPEEAPEAEDTPDEPEETPETEEVPDEPEEAPEAEDTPDEPAEAPETEDAPDEPEETPETEDAPDEPEETPETEDAPDEAEETPEAETAPDKPETVPEKTEKSVADMAARIAAGIEAGNIAPAEEPAEEAAEKPAEEPAEPQPKEDEPVFVDVPVPPRQQPPTESPYVEPELRENRMPGWAVTLILVVTCWLWIPLIIVLGLVALVCFVVPLVLGAALIAGAAYLTICGIWALGMITDALLMFGGAAVLLAFGLVLLWLAIWAVIRLFGLLGKGVGGAYRGIFCRKGGKERAE